MVVFKAILLCNIGKFFNQFVSWYTPLCVLFLVDDGEVKTSMLCSLVIESEMFIDNDICSCKPWFFGFRLIAKGNLNFWQILVCKHRFWLLCFNLVLYTVLYKHTLIKVELELWLVQ